MEQDFCSDSVPPAGPIDKFKVLDVKPLRCVVPVFPSPDRMASGTTPEPSPFVCVPPSGPFPPWVSLFYPFSSPDESGRSAESQDGEGFGSSISFVPVNSFRTPTANGDTGASRTGSPSATSGKKRGRPRKTQLSQGRLEGLLEMDFSCKESAVEESSQRGVFKVAWRANNY